MSNLLKVKIEKQSIGYILVWLLFCICFFHRYLIEAGVPDAFKYSIDLVNFALFFIALMQKQSSKVTSFMVICYMAMLLVGTVGFIANFTKWQTNVMYYVLDCRLLLRMPMFFYACLVLLRKEDVERLFTWILRFHILNSILIVYQYFTVQVEIFWMRGDNLNGFFGIATGGNIHVNALLIVTTLIVVYRRIIHQYSTKKAVFFIVLNLIISVLIELKMFFVEIIVMIVLMLLPNIRNVTKKQIAKGALAIGISIPVLYILVQALYVIYPWMRGTMSLSSMIQITSSSSGYTSSGDINRLSAVFDVIRMIFNGDIVQSIMGVGLGTASIFGESSLFYWTYYYTHYSWISMSYVFVETGFLGLISYIVSLMSPLFFCSKKTKYYIIVFTATFMAIVLVVYNETLKTEAGFLIFFLMSLGFIRDVDEEQGA